MQELIFMKKDFDQWNFHKKDLDSRIDLANFAERELWWCSIGLNIGSEQHSISKDFSRPVIVLRKLTNDIFLGVPLTTKIKSEKFRHRMLINGQENDVLLMQLRVFDRRRLIRNICTIDHYDFMELKKQVNAMINKTKTPFGVISGTSDFEVNVCNYSIADEICLSNELNYLLSKGEITNFNI